MFVRLDLTPSQRAVQAIHGALEASEYLDRDKEHPHLILLAISNEEELLKIPEKLNTSNIRHKIWKEPDIGNQVTSIATEPISGDRRKIFKKYKLLQ